jgi:transcriptional regulator with XRE-family HTH domain
MPCKIQIKENITRTIEDRTNDAFNKPLAVAQSIAKGVNVDFGTTVVRFVQREIDFIDRIIEVPSSLVDQYYYNEIAIEENEARSFQQEDAERAGENYSDDYLFLQQGGGVTKPGVEEVFNSVPELASVGTPEQYSQYLDTIFPNSEVKDVVYHGTGESTKIETFNARDGRIYFSDNLTASQYANWDEFNRAQDDPFSNPKAQVVPAIINLENAVTLDGVDFKETETNKEGDGIIGLNVKDPLGGTETQYVVRDASQVHVLGSKKDVQDFKKFVESSTPKLKASTSSQQTIQKVKQIAEQMGVDIQELSTYAKNNPEVDVTDVNGLADLLGKVIAIAEGKENVALTEEVVHIATAMIEQVEPKLITELISKIDKFKIYKQVLAEYSKNPKYQTKDGKPDIRKIKKEAVDKLISELIIKQSEGSTEFPELTEEINRSMVRKFWNIILDWFTGQYRKSNIELFENVANKISEVNFEIVDDLGGGVFLQVSGKKELTDAQKELQQKIQTTKEQIFKRTNENEKVDPILLDTEEASNFYEVRQPDGTFEKVTKRVTDRVKAWYKKRFGNKEFSEAQKEFNELKRELGVKFHYFFEDVHARYFNVDGTRRESVGKRNVKLDVLDDAAYDKIENYFVNLVEEFSKDGKNPLVFSEVVVYDPKEKEAGTIDLLIVDEDGKANIFDWKFMSISESATDVPWFKQGAFGIQLGRYKDILKDAYGVKEIGMNRAIPILMEFRKINPKDKNSKLQIKGINVGSVDVSEIEDLRLVPVSEETESTGDKRLDKLLKELNAIYRQISSKDATSDEEREFKRERMNLLKQAIRSAQSSQDISPMIDVIKVMRREGEQIINDWETIYSKRPASDKNLDNNELSDYADNVREYIAISQVFSKIDDLIGNLIYNKEMEQDAVTKEQKEEIAFRKSILDEIRDEKSKISNSRDEVVDIAGKFADKFMGERNLVKGLLSPQAVWKSLGSYFRGASESPLASVKVLFKLVTNARGKASSDANGLIDELLNIRKTLSDRGGNLRELVKKIYQKDSDNKIVNKLIYKYKKDFYTGVDDNAIEGKQEKSWLLKNINLDEYKKEALEMMNKRIKSINSLYSENEDLRDELILEERRKWDISRLDFNGWNNYIIKRHPSDIWLSEEYKELQNDPELLKLYNFISSVNDQATDVGYIQNKIHSTFLPFVRKSMAESIAWDFSLSTIMNFGKSLELNADDVGYGSINELTNELEHSIPKYYTTDFTKKENGEVDYTDVSEDLFKNMILYINHMQKYKYLSEVEGQLNLVKTVEGFKSHYETTRGGDIVMENGKPKEASGNVDNQKIFDDFLRALLYEEKYPLSSADTGLNVSVRNFMKKAINKVANKEVFPVEENPSAKSLVKVMDATNRAFQLKTLGFEIISGAVNAFGGNIQIATQAGNYFKAREVLKNETDLLANRFKSEDEREMFIQLINTFMPLKDDPSYDKLKKAGMSKLTRGNFSDMLMVFMRYPEQHIEKSLFKTLLDNTMVIDGKLVNIREYVKNKYKDRYSSAEAYKDSKSKIEDEIQELKQTSSISSTKKLEDGKLVIPGFDLNNRDEIQNLTNLARRIARNATGGIADADLNRMQMSIWTKSMMVFKNWIPKLVDTRFGEFRKISDDFSVEIDENGMTTGEKYDIGRVRLLIPFISFNIVKTIKEINDVISVTDAGISKLDALYNKYAEDYKNKTGQDLTMSKEDFNDLIITNLRNQIKELGILLSLFGAAFSLGLLSPDDDDDDKATKNAHRYAQKVVDKFIGELSFFYNPLEVKKLLSGSAFPAIGLFSDVTRFISHTSMEWTGIDVSDFDKSPEEVRKKAQPIKNLGKMLPLTKSLITYLAIFDSDFAKEYDVTIQKESNK